MILEEKINKLQKIGGLNDKKFSIKVSRKAFEILSGLYSDIPLAIVRELGCNAIDSHKMAGKGDVPIRIHLPNALEPFLEIQDFGLGLSGEDVSEIYSTYFSSTKTNTNDATGCLGLGSKSPFCYTDNFTVVSCHNGICRHYLAYFDEGGAPTITLASEENTQEGNGVRIQIPVKNSDFALFSDACAKAFMFQPVQPNYVGGTVKNLTPAFSLSGADGDWKIIVSKDNGSYYTRLSTSYAVMCGVAYPLNMDKLHNKNEKVCLSNIVLFCEDGSLNFAPSREALIYDDKTCNYLSSFIIKAQDEIADVFRKSIKDATSLQDAYSKYISLYNSFGGNTVANIGINSFTFKGKEYSRYSEIIKLGADNTEHFTSITHRSYRQQCSYSSVKDVTVQHVLAGSEVFLNDCKGAKSRVATYLKSGSTKSDSAIVVSQSLLDSLVALGFDASVVKNTSSLPTPAKAASSNNQYKVEKERCYTMEGRYSDSFIPTTIKDALSAGAKYYAIKDDAVKSSYEYQNKTLIEKVSELVFIAPTKAKMAIAAGLVSFKQHIEDFIKEIQGNQEVMEILSINRCQKNSVMGCRHNFSNMIRLLNESDARLSKENLAKLKELKSFRFSHFIFEGKKKEQFLALLNKAERISTSLYGKQEKQLSDLELASLSMVAEIFSGYSNDKDKQKIAVAAVELLHAGEVSRVEAKKI